VSFYICCGKGHRTFTATVVTIKDEEDGVETGDELVLLHCSECGEEEVLEVTDYE
jgi:hypothetical protein